MLSPRIDTRTAGHEAAVLLATIAADVENDAARFDDLPFNGMTVAAYLGNLGAAIAAVAKILGLMLDDPPELPPLPAAPAPVLPPYRSWISER